MKNLLIDHYKKYPEMQIQDMVKLIYQSEFAGGHLIPDEQESLKYLEEELKEIDSSLSSVHVKEDFEYIGNNLYRLFLHTVKNNKIKPETVNRFFVATSEKVKGSINGFQEKLEVLRLCCVNKELPFSVKELNAYLSEYRDKGYPPVSHSQVYKDEYKPFYRIVSGEYIKFFDLFSRIDELCDKKERVIVAIDGNCGSGKTTLASIIDSVYDCNLFHMDDFFLPLELRTTERLSQAGGNVHYERFDSEVIHGIKSNKAFEYQKFDCARMSLGEKITVTPRKLNIIEGSYSMHPVLIDNYDLKVFLTVSAEEQSRRILLRNGIEKHKRFINEWIPLENKYFAELGIKDKCDLVFET